MITIGLFVYVLLTPLIKGVEPDVSAPIVPRFRCSSFAHYIVPIVAAVGLAIAGDTGADGVHGDRLVSACVHARAVDAARIWKRIGGRYVLINSSAKLC